MDVIDDLLAEQLQHNGTPDQLDIVKMHDVGPDPPRRRHRVGNAQRHARDAAMPAPDRYDLDPVDRFGLAVRLDQADAIARRGQALAFLVENADVERFVHRGQVRDMHLPAASRGHLHTLYPAWAPVSTTSLPGGG